MTTTTAPFALGLDDERPIGILPEIPNWSENYAFIGYDYERRIGFIANAGRWVKDPALWREQFYLYLPDGSVLLHMAIGPAPSATIAGAGALRLDCVKPGGRWTIAFDGGMRREQVPDLLGAPLAQRVPEPVHFTAVIDHSRPVWMFGASENAAHGKFHYEQLGKAEGAFTFGKKRLEFSGPAYRDHSRGPRHLGGYQGHAWLQLHFTDRPPLACYHAWAATDGVINQVLDETVLITADGFTPVRIVTNLRMTSLADLQQPLELEIETGGGRLRLAGRPLATMVTSLTEEFDFYYGFPQGQADIVATDQPYLFDGACGPVTGYIQRSMRIARS